MNQKYFVKLTPHDREAINDVLSRGIASKTIRNRAMILLLADTAPGKPLNQKEIAVRCSVSAATVSNTIKEFCTQGVESTLTFKRTKATNPPIVTGDIEARIVALACSAPPKGFNKWTVRLLTEKVVELKILDTVSRETIRGTLKKQNLNLT